MTYDDVLSLVSAIFLRAEIGKPSRRTWGQDMPQPHPSHFKFQQPLSHLQGYCVEINQEMTQVGCLIHKIIGLSSE